MDEIISPIQQILQLLRWHIVIGGFNKDNIALIKICLLNKL